MTQFSGNKATCLKRILFFCVFKCMLSFKLQGYWTVWMQIFFFFKGCEKSTAFCVCVWKLCRFLKIYLDLFCFWVDTNTGSLLGKFKLVMFRPLKVSHLHIPSSMQLPLLNKKKKKKYKSIQWNKSHSFALEGRK